MDLRQSKDLKPWGNKVWVKLTKPGKLNSQSREGRFVGHDEESKGYRIYWPENRSLTVERDVVFEPFASEDVVVVDELRKPAPPAGTKPIPSIPTPSIPPTPPQPPTPPKIPTPPSENNRRRHLFRLHR